ncbi:MAG: hypothetical protein DWP97_00335 [Calditrichaeota bacterium]|nr:MAG: hypothetical protein DWP97_00335 [Calditrichota bacterium]
MIEKILKALATLIICGAGIILTGKVYAIILKPDMPIWEFIFLSENALYRHFPLGIAVGGIAYMVIKNSIKILFSIGILLIIAAAIVLSIY